MEQFGINAIAVATQKGLLSCYGNQLGKIVAPPRARSRRGPRESAGLPSHLQHMTVRACIKDGRGSDGGTLPPAPVDVTADDQPGRHTLDRLQDRLAPQMHSSGLVHVSVWW